MSKSAPEPLRRQLR